MSIRGIGDRWLAGETVPGVAFAHHQSVRIVSGPHADEAGRIVLLLAVEPAPVYVVAIGTQRRDVRVRQSELRAAD
jgi:transcription antitermination factor NusG